MNVEDGPQYWTLQVLKLLLVDRLAQVSVRELGDPAQELPSYGPLFQHFIHQFLVAFREQAPHFSCVLINYTLQYLAPCWVPLPIHLVPPVAEPGHVLLLVTVRIVGLAFLPLGCLDLRPYRFEERVRALSPLGLLRALLVLHICFVAPLALNSRLIELHVSLAEAFHVDQGSRHKVDETVLLLIRSTFQVLPIVPLKAHASEVIIAFFLGVLLPSLPKIVELFQLCKLHLVFLHGLSVGLEVTCGLHVLFVDFLLVRFGQLFLLFAGGLILFASWSGSESKAGVLFLDVDHEIVLVFLGFHQLSHRVTRPLLSLFLLYRFFLWIGHSFRLPRGKRLLLLWFRFPCLLLHRLLRLLLWSFFWFLVTFLLLYFLCLLFLRFLLLILLFQLFLFFLLFILFLLAGFAFLLLLCLHFLLDFLNHLLLGIILLRRLVQARVFLPVLSIIALEIHHECI